MIEHYTTVPEEGRLRKGVGQLESLRTREIIQRYLMPAPARILDVGGGAGIHALWLAQHGHEVHLIDPVPLHIKQAKAASKKAEHPLTSIREGDASHLDFEDASADAVLLLGPLYHLTNREDRLQALREAYRVLKPGRFVFGAAISRWASTLDGLFRAYIDDPRFLLILERDLADGQHRNLTGNPDYFTTSFFHTPPELRSEVQEAGFRVENVIAVEGPAWLMQNFEESWNDSGRREILLYLLRNLESEPYLLGASAHLLAIGRKVQ